MQVDNRYCDIHIDDGSIHGVCSSYTTVTLQQATWCNQKLAVSYCGATARQTVIVRHLMITGCRCHISTAENSHRCDIT